MTRPDAITAAQFAIGLIGRVPMPPTARMMDWRFEAHDPDARVLRVSVAAKPEFLNPAGTIQGGFLAAMADDVMGPLVVAATAAAKFPSTLDLHVSYFKAVRPGGRVVVEARVERLGGTIAFTSATLMDETGEVVAKAVQTARLVPLPGADTSTAEGG